MVPVNLSTKETRMKSKTETKDMVELFSENKIFYMR